ncbi:MAG: M23 family metallopeptidase [Lachnospiraceae bacterium]|nr:M23 family metallopeptidase [Lachnospiraceae bacterium]
MGIERDGRKVRKIKDHSGGRGRNRYGSVGKTGSRIGYAIRIELLLLIALGCVAITKELTGRWQGSESVREEAWRTSDAGEAVEVTADGNFIKWVEFNVTCEAMAAAYDLDVESYEKDVHLNWIELLAYVGARTGGKFDKNSVKKINETARQLTKGETTMEELTKDMEYYDYYLEAYTAVLGGMVGEFSLREENQWNRYYGLKAFSPIAKGFDYSHYDDFGASRSYGYSRPHLGHDMMGMIGTPIIAIESGVVEALGWNQYGGWRIGIRSFDGSRYYYYAHLRQNYPYAEGLEEGSVVTAGDVIGYMGHTGYSTKENVNNIETVHLHWGLQLIFDESQKEGNNEIWVDCYELTKFLYRNRSEVAKIEGTKEWKRTREMADPEVEKHCKKDTSMLQ